MANMNTIGDDDDATSGAGVGLLQDHDPDIEGLSSLYLYPESTLPLPTTASHGMTRTSMRETNGPAYTTVSTNTHDETEETTADEEDLHLPPLSSYVNGWRFWWRFAQVPILFLIVNVIVMVSLEDKQNRFGGPRSRHNNNYYEMAQETESYGNNDALVDPNFAKLRYKSIVLGILFLVDTAVLFRVALFMEKSVQALRRQESHDAVEATYSLTHVHAKASKMMDHFLSRGRSKLPEVSVFINILYLMTGFCLVATAVSLSLYWFLHTSKADSVCNSYHETSTEVDLTIKGVPDELQSWASLNGDEFMYDAGGSSSGTYVHMVNGMTYFAASNQTEDKLNPNEDMYYGYGTQVLFTAGPDGTLQSYPQITVPEQFTNMAGPSEQASEGFCCLYRNKTVIVQDWGSVEREQKLLCIFAGDDDDDSSPTLSSNLKESDKKGQLPKEMKTLSFPFQEEGNGSRNKIFQKSLSGLNIRPYDGLVYLRVRWYVYNTRTGGSESEQMEIYSLKPQALPLNWTFVGTATMQQNYYYDYIYDSDGRQKSPCFVKIKTVGTVVGVPLLFLTAYGLLIWRDIPAGMACFCVGVLAILSSVSEELAVGVGALTSVVGATILSLCGTTSRVWPSWVSRDMVLWGIYATMAMLALASRDFWCCWKWPAGRLCLVAVTGFVLDHPVLDMMGWMGATMTLYSLFLAIRGPTTNYRDVYYSDGRNIESSLWPAVLLGLLLTFGLFSLSFSLQKCRPYLVAYWRRFRRILHLASRNTPSSQSQAGQSNITNNNTHSNTNTSDTVLVHSLLTIREE
jgi:hypothetical protein